METGSFKQFVEQKFGKFPYFLIYAFFEWVLIILLFIDGLIAFAANELARFFELKIPCLLCTRIDHVLVHRKPDFYYNDSICEAHRKDVSWLAYCHVHQRLSDIRWMCEGCLLSFATENKSNCDTYKSLVGILGADLECSVEEDHKIHLRLPAGEKNQGQVEKNSVHRCSCCGEPLRIKTSFPPALVQSQASNGGVQIQPTIAGNVPQTPAPSPGGLVTMQNEELRGFDPLPHVQYTELRFISDTESDIPEDENGLSTLTPVSQCREDAKAATIPLLTESEDLNDETCKTPGFIRVNRIFGITSTDSATASPRWQPRLQRRLLAEKTELSAESLEGNVASEVDGETILHLLKRQARLDRKSLIALYMELDEERSASAIAANQAMAMITRLQAEKAAVQMEALQYQRMMEEQAEYDQEALQDMKDMLTKREEEIKFLEAKVKAYRPRVESEEALDIEGCKAWADEDYQNFKSHSNPSTSQKSECGSLPANLDEDVVNDGDLEHPSIQTGPSQVKNGCGIVEPFLDHEGERRYLMERLKMLQKIHSSSNSGDHFMLPSSNIINLKEEYRGDGSDTIVTREISHLSKRLVALENDREFLKHAFQSLQKGDEGTELLREITQHLRELRHVETSLEGVV